MLKSFRESIAAGYERERGQKSIAFDGPLSGRWWGMGGSRRTPVDYTAEAGDLWLNATCMTCIAWMQRTLPEAPLVVTERQADGQEKPIPDHALVQLFNRPGGVSDDPETRRLSRFWTYKGLMSAALVSYMTAGNAYFLKVRRGGAGGPVVALQYAPHWTIKAIPDSRLFISRYDYQVNGNTLKFEVEDVVHLRYGRDPRQPWYGISPWAANLPEISADNQGSIYSESLLRNGGAIAGVASPKDSAVILTDEHTTAIKAALNAQTTGGRAGGWLVSQGALDYQKLSMSPEEMTLDKLRTYPQDMICAAVGLSTLLLDLPSGKDTRTYANKTEAREAAYESNVVPTLDAFADEFDLQLLPDFETDPARHCSYDLSNVRVLQPDIDKQYERQSKAVGGPWMTPNESRALSGLKPIEGGDLLYKKTAPVANPQDAAAGGDPNADPNAEGSA